MIKRLADLSLRLVDLVEAEGRLARAHALRFLSAGLLFAIAAVLSTVALIVLGAAAVLGLAESGLSWPVSLLIASIGLAVGAAALGLIGRAVLRAPSSSPPRVMSNADHRDAEELDRRTPSPAAQPDRSDLVNGRAS